MRILLLCALVAGACASGWNYDSTSNSGPANWPNECVLSTSYAQSPIDIVTSAAICNSYPTFSFSGYDDVDVELFNNGHTVEAELAAYENAILSGGALCGTYKLAQFHFHWGSSDSQGSEHKLDGVQFPMEVHFVHYNTKYASLGDAADKKDGLAVLAFLFEVKEKSEEWEPLIGELPINEEEDAAHIHGLDLTKLMGSVCSYYRYQGSLTTPPCYQSVTWTVFDEKIQIDSSQMDKFRDIENVDGEYMYDNFRPTQQLYGRPVYKV